MWLYYWYLFQSNFEELYLKCVPTSMLPGLLKNNFLKDPALSLIKGVDSMPEIWKRLRCRVQQFWAVFTEASVETRLSSYAQETSYVQNNGESDEELDDSGKGDSRNIQLKHTSRIWWWLIMKIWRVQRRTQLNKKLLRKNTECLTLLLRNSEKVRSMKQSLSEVATRLKALVHSSTTHHHMIMKAEWEREESYMAVLKGRIRENQEHELRIAEILWYSH